MIPSQQSVITPCLRPFSLVACATRACRNVRLPISEPLKQMLWIKGIDAARVVHPSDLFPYLRNDTEHAELVRPSQSSWPVLWVHDERPRSCWLGSWN